jgi:hypothetical protein
MGGRCWTIGTLATGFASTFFSSVGLAQSSAPPEHAGTPAPAAVDEPVSSESASSVRRQATQRGFIFHPSTPVSGGFRFALGAFYDAIDPQVMYGFNVRVPQITLDARLGLGSGWSLKGHFNSMFVTTELLLGGAYGWRAGSWSFEGAASVGVYFGKLGQLGFDSVFIAPQYRPELTIGYDFGSIALALRGSVLLMGPERVRVGEVWGGLDNANVFVGHSEMLFVENTTRSDSIWYFGLGAMTTRSYYALWVLLPDSPALFTYARVAAGYEF